MTLTPQEIALLEIKRIHDKVWAYRPNGGK